MTQVIAVSAGVPCAGATTFAVALALELARRSYKIGLLDADWSGTNAGAALCLRSEWTLLDLARGEAGIERVVDRRTPGIDYLPGGGSSQAFPRLEPEHLQRLAQRLSLLPEYDYLIVDVAAGTDKNRLALLEAADTLITVGTPGAGLLNETYELIKRLNQHGCAAHLSLLLNGCRNHTAGWHAYGRLREVTDFYLSLRIPLLGIVREVASAPTHGTSALQSLFEAPTLRDDVARCTDRLCAGELGQASGSLPDFWRRFLKAADVPQAVINVDRTEPLPAPGRDVHEQLDKLSAHIESLIDQLERYSSRLSAETPTAAPPHLKEEPASEPPRDARYWLAGVSYEAEGEAVGRFEAFRVRQSSGRVVRCVWFAPSD